MSAAGLRGGGGGIRADRGDGEHTGLVAGTCSGPLRSRMEAEGGVRLECRLPVGVGGAEKGEVAGARSQRGSRLGKDFGFYPE